MLIGSFIKTGLRGMRKSKGFTAIGVFSLSIGMAVWLLLTLLVDDQLQYDQFHTKADRIVRVTSSAWNASIELMVPLASSPAPVGPTLASTLPDVENYVRLTRVSADVITEQGVIDLHVFATDTTFFDVFDFAVGQNHAASFLNRPNTIVLTKAAAYRLFSTDRVISQTVQLGTLGEFEITGIVNDPPRQGHIQFEALVSMSSFASGHLASTSIAESLTDWQGNDRFWSYVVIHPDVDRALLESNINRVLRSNYPSDLREHWAFRVEALPEIAFVNRDLGNQMGPVVGQRTLFVISLFAFAILLIAVFNYIGLAISRSIRRSREVGVRKALGANRIQLIQQFLSESVLVSLTSLIISTLALVWLIPIFNNLRFMRLAGVSVSLEGLLDASLIASFIGIALLIGLAAGIAPAIYLSKFRAARILAGSHNQPTRGIWRFLSRRTLISIQFAASVLFVVIAISLWRQIDTMLVADFGFDKEEIVGVELQGSDFTRFQNSAQHLSSVKSISATSSLPIAGSKALTYLQSDSLSVPLFTYWYSVDASLLNTLGIDLVAGRGFDANRLQDQSEALILNETAAREMGFQDPRDAIDQWVRVGLESESQSRFRIIGVTRDFFFENDRYRIRRLALFNDPTRWKLAVVAPSNDAVTAQEDLEHAWYETNKNLPYQANTFGHLLSESLDPVKDIRFIITIAAGLALFLSCLGLIGPEQQSWVGCSELLIHLRCRSEEVDGLIPEQAVGRVHVKIRN